MERSLVIIAAIALSAWGSALTAGAPDRVPQQAAEQVETTPAAAVGSSDVDRLEAESEKAGRVPLSESDC
jgi:hypothetical protein